MSSHSNESPNSDQTMLVDGFHAAIIGLDTSQDVCRVVYDINKIISIMMDFDEMTLEDALEHFDYNIRGAYVGEGTPIYVYGGDHEEVLELLSNY